MKKLTLLAMASLMAMSGMAEEDDFDAADFVGAVLKKNGFACGRGCVISEDGGMAYAVGRSSIISTDGFYYRSGNNVIGQDTYVTKTGTLFFGTKTSIKAGGAYMNDGGVFVGSSDNEDEE